MNNTKKKIQRPRKKKGRQKEQSPWKMPDEFHVEDWAGFVYMIVHKDTQKSYVGRKYFFSEHKVKIPGKKRKQHVTKESDWKYYRSSCKELQQWIEQEGVDAFRWNVLELCTTRADCNYKETFYQFRYDVLYDKLPTDEFKYLNGNILNRYFRK